MKASYTLSSKTGISSFTSITCTVSCWVLASRGTPWSSATTVRLNWACSSRLIGFRIEREPAGEWNQLSNYLNKIFFLQSFVDNCFFATLTQSFPLTPIYMFLHVLSFLHAMLPATFIKLRAHMVSQRLSVVHKWDENSRMARQEKKKKTPPHTEPSLPECELFCLCNSPQFMSFFHSEHFSAGRERANTSSRHATALLAVPCWN